MQWARDSGSIAVYGHTQSGKTSLCRQVHAENGRVSVWINRRGNERVPDVAGKPVRGVKAIVSGLGDGTRKFNYLASDPAQALAEVQDWMFSVAERHGRSVPMQVVGDEWEDVSPETQKNQHTGRDATLAVTKEGQKRDIKGVWITQDPVSMSKRVLRQTEYTLLFENHFSQADSLRNLGLPFDRAQQLPEYHALVISSDGSIIGQPVKAKARYA